MAGPLNNPKHERFCQERAKGALQFDAYRTAGYSGDEAHASRLGARADVQARIEEILGRAAAKAEVTVGDILRQLDEDRDFAKKCKAPAAAVSATLGKAKLLGLLRDKVEHTGKDGGPIEIDQVTSDADAFTRAIAGLAARRAAEGGADQTQH